MFMLVWRIMAPLKRFVEHVDYHFEFKLKANVIPFDPELHPPDLIDNVKLRNDDSAGLSKGYIMGDFQSNTMQVTEHGLIILSDVLIAMQSNLGATKKHNVIMTVGGAPIRFPFRKNWSTRTFILKCKLILTTFAILANLKKCKPYRRVLLLGTTNSDNYFHFWAEVVSDILVTKSYFQDMDFDAFIVPGVSSSWQYEILEKFGIDRKKVLWRDNDILKCSELVYMSYPKGSATQITKLSISNMAEGMKKFTPKKCDVDSVKRIFVTRSDAVRRRMLNSHVLEERLRSKGFVSVTLSGMSVQQQAALFASAQIIIGEHGAGLTNILWCDRDALVIELHAGPTGVPCFKLISQTIQCKFFSLFCCASTIDGNENWCLSDASLEEVIRVVDTHLFNRSLESEGSAQ